MHVIIKVVILIDLLNLGIINDRGRWHVEDEDSKILYRWQRRIATTNCKLGLHQTVASNPQDAEICIPLARSGDFSIPLRSKEWMPVSNMIRRDQI